MNMVRPTPLPEELDLGYFGRIMRINGFQSERDTEKNMDRMFGSESERPGKRTRLELLSLTAGQSLLQFLQGHSTIPFRRSITPYLPDLAHGSPEIKQYNDDRHMEHERPGAHLCPACVSEDVMFHGISYWRRNHQMLGLLYCPKHRTPLHYVAHSYAFLHPPAMSVVSSKSIDAALVNEALNSNFVTRFLDVASGLSVRPSSVACRHAACMLYRRATDKGLNTKYGRLGKDLTGPLLSDLMDDSFPHNWLTDVFPRLPWKIPGEKLGELDSGVFSYLGRRPLGHYILVAAMLFDTADEALNALFNAAEEFSEKPVRGSIYASLGTR